MIAIRPADLPGEVEIVRALFREYADGLGIDLCFQGFDDELASLPGKYAPPSGRLLLATDANEVLGCVALRPVDQYTGEMKRLYVRPAARHGGLGRRLAERICGEARTAGYQRICLDTLASMTAALTLYEKLGFRPVSPYVFNPIAGAVFLGLPLIQEKRGISGV